MFDAESFLNTTTTDAGNTEYVMLDEDTQLRAVAERPSVRQTQSGSTLMEINWVIDAPDHPRANGRKARQTIWLDIKDDMLDQSPGANVPLGQLRETLGQNEAGQIWSPLNIEGAVAEITIVNRLNDGKHYIDVKNVFPL